MTRMVNTSFCGLLAVASLTGLAGPTEANLVMITGVTTTSLSGTNNPPGSGGSSSNAYVDDVLLDTISFPGGMFSQANGNFLAILQSRVVFGAGGVNAEFGDADTGSDGNPNPFVKAGIINEGDPLPPGIRESSDPAIQNPSITAAFSSLSLSEVTDGEGPDYAIDFLLNMGLVDDPTPGIPELIFFERGSNSDFDIQAIIGGSLDNPLFAPATISVVRGNLFNTGIFINTIEIGSGQVLGAIGVDAGGFGLAPGQPVYGFRLTSTNNSGADLAGAFASGDPSQFVPPLGVIPEPGSLGVWTLLAGLTGAAGAYRRLKMRTRGRTHPTQSHP